MDTISVSIIDNANNNISLIKANLDFIIDNKFFVSYKVHIVKNLENAPIFWRSNICIIFTDTVDGVNNKTSIVSFFSDKCSALITIGKDNRLTTDKFFENGAFEHIDIDLYELNLLHALKRAFRVVFCDLENQKLLKKAIDCDNMVGSSNSMRHMRSIIEKTSNSLSRVMIVGPLSSGKKLAAKLIYKKSKHIGDFIVCNTKCHNEEELNRLFSVDLDGNFFQRADNGVLYIDECTMLPMEVQNKLLSFIHNDQFGTLQNFNNSYKVRIMASSSEDVDFAIRSGTLREDLYYRLRVIPIRMPSLVERIEDISDLSEYFVNFFVNFFDLPYKKFNDDLISIMQTYHWPYNIGQFKNIVEWILIVSKASNKKIIGPEIFSPTGNADMVNTIPDIVSMTIKDARKLFETKYLMAQINRFGGNISKTAEFIKMERSALHRKLSNLRIKHFEHNE